MSPASPRSVLWANMRSPAGFFTAANTAITTAPIMRESRMVSPDPTAPRPSPKNTPSVSCAPSSTFITFMLTLTIMGTVELPADRNTPDSCAKIKAHGSEKTLNRSAASEAAIASASTLGNKRPMMASLNTKTAAAIASVTAMPMSSAVLAAAAALFPSFRPRYFAVSTVPPKEKPSNTTTSSETMTSALPTPASAAVPYRPDIIVLTMPSTIDDTCAARTAPYCSFISLLNSSLSASFLPEVII